MRNFRQHPIRDEECDRYFCLRCTQERANLADMLSHHKAAHGGTGPVSGEDFASGLDVRRMIEREDAEADRFDRACDSLRGVDDFLLECGDA